MRISTATVLQDFQRTVRDEPFYYLYRIKIWVVKDSVPAEELVPWLRERYVERPRGHRYRVVTYRSTDKARYVDYLLMETCSDADLVYMKLRWGWSKTAVARGNRVPRRRLTPQQRADLDRIIQQTREGFYASL